MAEPTLQPATAGAEPMPPRRQVLRRVVLGLLIAAFVGGAIYIYRVHHVTPSSLRDWLRSLGPWAPLLYVGTFILGAFVGLPGMMIVIGGRLTFGPELGFVVAYVGGVLGTWLPFLGARALRKASGPAWKPRGKLMVKLYALLETHPLLAVIAIRLVVWFNSPLSYALAMTPLPTRKYLLGCAIALAPVVAVAMIATGWFA